MTRQDFVYSLVEGHIPIKKENIHIVDMIDCSPEVLGQYISDHEMGEYKMFIQQDQFNDLSLVLSTVAHEVVHIAMNDLLLTLVNQGCITQETSQILTERAAYICDNLVKDFTNAETRCRFHTVERSSLVCANTSPSNGL